MNNSFSQHSKSLKSHNSLTSLDSIALKNNLHGFYKNSKDRLLKLKTEIDDIEQDNEKYRVDNTLQQEKIDELTIKVNKLSNDNKDQRAKNAELNKKKATLLTQQRNLEIEIEEVEKEIEAVSLQNQYKIKIIQSDIEHLNNQKEVNIKTIQGKIEHEEQNEMKLNDKITEIKNDINRYKKLIRELQYQDKERNDLILEETLDMKKFIAEL